MTQKQTVILSGARVLRARSRRTYVFAFDLLWWLVAGDCFSNCHPERSASLTSAQSKDPYPHRFETYQTRSAVRD